MIIKFPLEKYFFILLSFNSHINLLKYFICIFIYICEKGLQMLKQSELSVLGHGVMTLIYEYFSIKSKLHTVEKIFGFKLFFSDLLPFVCILSLHDHFKLQVVHLFHSYVKVYSDDAGCEMCSVCLHVFKSIYVSLLVIGLFAFSIFSWFSLGICTFLRIYMQSTS